MIEIGHILRGDMHDVTQVSRPS